MEEDGDLHSAVHPGMELPDEAYDLDITYYLEETWYQARKGFDRIEMYVDYQETLLGAIGKDEVPSHLVLPDSEEEIWAQIYRASHKITREWNSLRPELKQLEDSIDKLKTDWERYREDRMHEPKFLQKHELDRSEDYKELVQRYDVLRTDAMQTMEKISAMNEKLPGEIAEELPSREELTVGSIVAH